MQRPGSRARIRAAEGALARTLTVWIGGGGVQIVVASKATIRVWAWSARIAREPLKWLGAGACGQMRL